MISIKIKFDEEENKNIVQELFFQKRANKPRDKVIAV